MGAKYNQDKDFKINVIRKDLLKIRKRILYLIIAFFIVLIILFILLIFPYEKILEKIQIQREIDQGLRSIDPNEIQNIPAAPCIPEWNCNPWSECIDGKITRECSDNNMCENSENRPTTSLECIDKVVAEKQFGSIISNKLKSISIVDLILMILIGLISFVILALLKLQKDYEHRL